MAFPRDFVWGAASASYQIEGASSADGKGPSIWDEFCRRPGAIFAGQDGNVACDAYHRYEEDIALMAALGIPHYRFSLSWPRIFPRGTGAVNEGGLAYYDGVVDCCLRHGITPWITLYHWDLPAALPGGWERAETAEAFAQYAAFVAEHFKGRVRRYFTLNEPQCSVALGYDSGTHAPGKQLRLPEVFRCWKHILIANGLAVRAIREAEPSAQVGIVSTGDLCYPETEADIEGARALSFGEGARWNFTHHWLLDPICLGRFPDTRHEDLARAAQGVTDREWALIRVDMDHVGINQYHGHAVTTDRGVPQVIEKHPGYPRTGLKWPVTPQVLRWGTRFLWERYELPLYISENGQACNDRIFLDGAVHDPDRIDYLHRYLRELSKACEDGVPVRGYFHWSFTDNFEWNSGYEDRFGLIYVDYPTQRRIPKDSAAFYARTVLENGMLL